MVDAVTPMWLIVVLSFGLALIAAAVGDAHLDRLALKRRGVNGARKLVARQALRRNVVKLVVSGLLFALVMWSGVAGQDASAAELRDILYVRNMGVAVAVLILGVSAGWDLYDQHKLRGKVALGEFEPPPGR